MRYCPNIKTTPKQIYSIKRGRFILLDLPAQSSSKAAISVKSSCFL